jgi:flagellum-specific peptidoglycan hydrolase FlgJ
MLEMMIHYPIEIVDYYLINSHCLIDHQEILKRPQFKDAWPYRKDPIEYTKHIVDGVGGKYATDPNYVKTMTSLIGSIEKEVKRLGL